MARELVLEVVARKNSKDLNALADEFEKLAAKSDSAGKSLGKTTTFSQHLDEQIAKTRATVRELGVEFDRTGNKDVFAKLRGAQANLKSLEGIRKQLSTALEQGAVSAGEGASQGFIKGFSSSMSNPETAAALAGAAAVGAAVLGNVVSAAVLTGVGLAGIGAGIAGQLHDPRVMAAASTLGKDVSDGFKDATRAFAEPMVEGLYVIDQEWAKLQSGLNATFTELSPLVVDLSKGAAGFADELVPALERAAIAAKPLVQDFAQWLPKFGHELGGFFDALANNAQSLKWGLDGLEGAISGVTQAATLLVPVVSKVGEVFGAADLLIGPAGTLLNVFNQFKDAGSSDMLGKSLVANVDELSGSFGHGALTAEQLSSEIDRLGSSALQLAPSLDTVAGKMSEVVFSSMMNVDQANLSVAESLTKVSDAVQKNGLQLDIHTAKGQANRETILASVSANMAQYQSLIASGIGAQDAAAAYDQNTASLEQQLRAAGWTSAQIDGLIGKYRGVPSKVDTVMATEGLTESINGLADLLRLINHIPKYIPVTIDTIYTSSGPSGGYHWTNPGSWGHGMASGGIVVTNAAVAAAAKGMVYAPSNPPLIQFAEPQTGGEAYIPRRGIPAARGLALANTAASWYGGAVVSGSRPSGGALEMRITDGSDGAVATMINYLMRAGLLSFYDSNGQRITTG